jgi:uncharacterized membrane protein YedE/YeeE
VTIFVALASGLLFGVGLIAGGMTDPSKIQGFLDLFGQWDPSLALVMGGAILVGVIGFAAARRRKVAWSGEAIELPDSRLVDSRLLVGGALFGIGWGLGGLCPGPAITALGAGFMPAIWFVAAMLVGMWLHDRFLGTLFARR